MKVILLLGGLLGVCCIAVTITVFASGWLLSRGFNALLSRSFSQSPQHAAEIGQSILNYRLPPGYSELGAMNLLGNQAVLISREDDRGMMIMIIRLIEGTGSNEEEIRRLYVDQFISRSLGPGARWVGARQITLKGQPVTLTIMEGTSERGRSLREGIAVSNVDGSAIMLSIAGPIKAWDSDDLNIFLESIR